MLSTELKLKRHSLGLRVKDLADIGGVSLREAQRWESGKRPPADVVEKVEKLWNERVQLLNQVVTAGKQEGSAVLDTYVHAGQLKTSHRGLEGHHAFIEQAMLALSLNGVPYEVREIKDTNKPL